MTHTPRPWEIEQPSDKTTLAYIPDGDPDSVFEALNIFDADGNQVAIIPIDPYLGTAVDDNARLIAAAPDLLAACGEAREKITGIEDIFDDLAQILDLAIAKAEGK